MSDKQPKKFAGWHGLGERDIELLSRHAVKLYKIPGYLYGDALSEAYLGFAEASGEFRPELGFKFTTFGMKYAKNRVFRMARREANRLRTFDTSSEGSKDCCRGHASRETRKPDEIASDRELGRIAMQMLDELPDKSRELTAAVVLGGMTGQRAADIAGIPRRTASGRVLRALQAMRSRIEPEAVA